jgi:peptidyl-prolyl cis-trans isomerase B (cyclophilin B)
VARAPIVLLCALALAGAGCGGGEEGSAAEGGEEDASRTQPGEQSACRQVEQPRPRPDGGARKPRTPLDAGKTYDVQLATNCGDFTIRLDQKTSPRTAASFAALARSGFYDGTVIHRIVPGFVIQGGDPTGRGDGGPGYSTRDVPPPDAAYTEGVVAMAKTATEPPGTAGSQFYVVTAPDAGLPPEYALLGRVVEGLDVVRAIGELGDPASGDAGTPLETVVIEEAKVRES